MSRRYAVAKYCFGGIGDHLLCLMGAWWLARRTGRILVVDWRGSRFNPDPVSGRNCFADYFEPVVKLGGVELIADDRVRNIDYPAPIWPDKWNPSTLNGLDHLKHTTDEMLEANRRVHSEEDSPQPTFVLNAAVDSVPRDALRVMLEDLRPTESISAEAQLFWDQNIGSAAAVAIHLRHGNGENVGRRAAYWLGPIALIRQLNMDVSNDIHGPGLSGRFSDNAAESLVGTPGQAAAERRFCRHVAARFRAFCAAQGLTNAIPFLFCDSAQIIETMRLLLPALVVRPKRLLARGEGPLHQLDASIVRRHTREGVSGGSISAEITRDMFVELELMQRCSGLLYMDSGFSILLRTTLDQNRISRLQPNLVNRIITRVLQRLTPKWV